MSDSQQAPDAAPTASDRADTALEHVPLHQQLAPAVDQSSAQESTPPDRDGEQESAIPPGSLRVDPQLGEELYGAQFTGTAYSHVTSHGPAAYGDHNTIHHVSYQGQPPAKPIIRQLVGVPELTNVYARSAADDPLDAVLRHRSTACLTGPPNTGRFSTACAALARRHGPNRVHEVLLPADVTPEVLHRDPDCIADDHGYVIRLPGDGHVQAMRQLADAFRRRSASLLLIRDADARVGERHSAEVSHGRPDPRTVFRYHLRHRLRRQRGLTDVESDYHASGYLQHAELGAALDATYGPREVVAIAEAVARRHPADEAALAEIVDLSQPRRRQRAAEILRSRGSEKDRRHRRADQHERAFRIAYAVFCWQPLHYVFEAAGQLLEQIDGEANRSDWGRFALQHPVSELLGPLDRDWQEGQERARSRGGASRSVWLHDAGMRGAIIDVAWHEFDSTRPSLLKWLDTLADSDDDRIRRASAQAAGVLAHHDFDRLCEDLIDKWAASAKSRVRQTAAWATVAADMGGEVNHLVRAKVREWSHGRLNYQRDTAARVYASGLQQPDLSWSLSDLRRIAEDRMQQDTHVVAEGVNQLYTTDRADPIICELARWAQDRQLQRHAANALLALAWRTADDSPIGLPELMTRLAVGGIDGSALAQVWRVALLAPDTSHRGWALFGDWLSHAESDESLRKCTSELVSNLARNSAVRRRMEFHVLRLSGFTAGLPRWIDLAMRER